MRLRANERIMGDIQVFGVSLISPQTPDHSLSMKEKHELCFHFLSDPGNKKAEHFILKYKLPDYMHEFLRNVGMILKVSELILRNTTIPRNGFDGSGYLHD